MQNTFLKGFSYKNIITCNIGEDEHLPITLILCDPTKFLSPQPLIQTQTPPRPSTLLWPSQPSS